MLADGSCFQARDADGRFSMFGVDAWRLWHWRPFMKEGRPMLGRCQPFSG